MANVLPGPTPTPPGYQIRHPGCSLFICAVGNPARHRSPRLASLCFQGQCDDASSQWSRGRGPRVRLCALLPQVGRHLQGEARREPPLHSHPGPCEPRALPGGPSSFQTLPGGQAPPHSTVEQSGFPWVSKSEPGSSSRGHSVQKPHPSGSLQDHFQRWGCPQLSLEVQPTQTAARGLPYSRRGAQPAHRESPAPGQPMERAPLPASPKKEGRSQHAPLPAWRPPSLDSQSVSRSGCRCCRWWQGWRSRPRCTRARCRTGWCC